MRLPNGYGGIRKLQGKRRRPYQAVITLSWELVDGKKRQKQKVLGAFATKSEALNALAEWNKDPTLLERATFAEVWDMFIVTQEGKATSTQRALKRAFTNSVTLHDLDIATITGPQLQNVVDEQKSHSSQAQFISAYRGLFSFAFSHGFVKDNVAKNIMVTKQMPKPKVNPLTKSEIAMLPDKYKLFLYTGLRVNEMMNVTVDDIDVENEIILVRGSKTENALRHVPIHAEIRDMVLATTDRLWKWVTHQDSVRKEFKTYLPNHKVHDLRKTFATACYLSGVDDVITKRLMGHSVSDLTHSTYIKNDDIKLLRDAMDKVDLSLLK